MQNKLALYDGMPKNPNPCAMLENASEISVLWVEFGGELDGRASYRASRESIAWIPKSKVLRFVAMPVEGEDEYNLGIDIHVRTTLIAAKIDVEDGQPITFDMAIFTGRDGLLLEHRTRSKYLSILIK